MDYQVDLDSFRGPLDLLLYLVKHNEVDICDIPIARITEQFHEHLRVLQEVIDVERVGDFMVMAATLMEIKSRMLLPRPEEAAEEEADPRLELVRQLMEYKQFKDAALVLESRAEERLSRLPRQPLQTPAAGEGQQLLAPVELWDQVSAFGRLMRETLALQPKQIVVDETPVGTFLEIEGPSRRPFVEEARNHGPHKSSMLVGCTGRERRGEDISYALVPLAGQREHAPDLGLAAGFRENFRFVARDHRGRRVHFLGIVHDAVGRIFREDHEIHAGKTGLHADDHVGDFSRVVEHLRLGVKARHLVVHNGDANRVVT